MIIVKLKEHARFFGILLLIVIAGFMARTYHLDYPSIGYHNMKENEVLSIAQEMQRTGDYTTSRIYFYDGLSDNPGKRGSIHPPLVPYQIILAWRLFGENLWGPRLMNVMFGIGSILLIYVLGVWLLGSPQAGLWSAVFMATMPLSVFFSRNLQAESPAFFFMLLGSVFYVRFTHLYKKRNLVIGSLAFLCAWLYNAPFVIGAFVFLWYIPWKQLKRQRPDFWLIVAGASAVFCVIMAYVFLRTGQLLPAQFIRTAVAVFTPAYWQQFGRSIWWYTMAENYTYVFILLAVLGVIVSVLKDRQRIRRYMAGWLAAAVLYGMLFPFELGENSFFQMPFLAPLCLGAAYAACYFVQDLSRFIRQAAVGAVAVIILSFSLPQSYAQLQRLYGTLFMGVEAAGQTLKEFTGPDERVFLYTYAQGYGIARYAGRYTGAPATIADFIEKQERFGVRFICFYPGDYFHMFQAQQPELYGYIDKNYVLKELGLMEHPDRLGYVILERGTPKKPLSELFSQVAGRKEPRSIYEISGIFHFFYTLRPVDEAEVPREEKAVNERMDDVTE